MCYMSWGQKGNYLLLPGDLRLLFGEILVKKKNSEDSLGHWSSAITLSYAAKCNTERKDVVF